MQLHIPIFALFCWFALDAYGEIDKEQFEEISQYLSHDTDHAIEKYPYPFDREHMLEIHAYNLNSSTKTKLCPIWKDALQYKKIRCIMINDALRYIQHNIERIKIADKDHINYQINKIKFLLSFPEIISWKEVQDAEIENQKKNESKLTEEEQKHKLMLKLNDGKSFPFNQKIVDQLFESQK